MMNLDALMILFAKAHVVLAKAAVAVSAAAEAGEHAAAPAWGAPVWGVPSGVWHIINFAILVAFFVWVGRKASRAGQAAKRERISKAINEAAALRDEMRAKFEDYDARMKNIDERMNQLVSDARAEAEMEKKKALEDANALAKRIREDARLVADQEIARAKRELQEEQIAQAATLAEGILRANVNSDDQKRLSSEFMGRLGEKHTNGRQA